MKLLNKRIAAQNRARRYLAQKQFEKTQKEDHNTDMFMAFIIGISVAVVVGMGYQMYVMGAL
tara:strand:- start:129 stop:314 length:186 start_codon:yes stop_codon:yes gene_type:complete